MRRHDDTALPHRPIHDGKVMVAEAAWHHRHRVTDDMFVSCMAGGHQWVTVGKYRLYSPLRGARGRG